MKAKRHRKARAFTLIELLVVVAIIALLISILLPSLARAREQGNRAVCLSNLHQQGIGFSMYSADYKGVLPIRGGFAYNIKEPEGYHKEGANSKERQLVGTGSLYGRYAGKEGYFYYCPTGKVRTYDNWENGWPSFHVARSDDPRWTRPDGSNMQSITWGSYMYAGPVPYGWYPKDDGKAWITPPNKMINAVRNEGGKKLDGTQTVEDPNNPWMSAFAYANTLGSMWSRFRVKPYFGRVQALVVDSPIDNPPSHKWGFSVLFQDYHAKFVPDPDGKIHKIQGAGSGIRGAEGLCLQWNMLSRSQ